MGKGTGKGRGKGGSPLGDIFEDPQQLRCCGCILVTLILVVVILIAIMVDTVEPLEYGLHFNSITKKVVKENDPEGPKTYTGGRYILGIGHSFKRFEKTWINTELTGTDSRLEARAQLQSTEDDTEGGGGLQIYVQLAYQYKLNPEAIYYLYKCFNVGYTTIFQNKIRGDLIDALGQFEKEDYYTYERREVMSEQLLDVVRSQVSASVQGGLESLRSGGGNECELTNNHQEGVPPLGAAMDLQILQIDMKAATEQSLLDTLVTEQVQRQKEFEQTVNTIYAETDANVNAIDVESEIIINEGVADYDVITNEAIATASRNVIETEASKYKELRNRLNLTNDQLNEFRYYTALEGAEENIKILMDFDNGAFIEL